MPRVILSFFSTESAFKGFRPPQTAATPDGPRSTRFRSPTVAARAIVAIAAAGKRGIVLSLANS